ncbi:MAG: hypothetical protein GY795_33095 [Desulfobacterales bacterium]|nr:hypothetical protein [Desulfobacterales bacterium]
MSQNFRGPIRGKTLLFYTKECSVSLLNAVYGESVKTSVLTETGIATLNEIGNIIMVSCISQMADMLGSRIFFDLPEVTVEISDNYFNNLLKELGELDKAIIVKSEMDIKENDIQGYVFMLLSFDDFSFVVDSLKGKMK